MLPLSTRSLFFHALAHGLHHLLDEVGLELFGRGPHRLVRAACGIAAQSG